MKPLTPAEIETLDARLAELEKTPGATTQALATDAEFRDLMTRLAEEGMEAPYTTPGLQALAGKTRRFMQMFGPKLPGERAN